MFDQVVTWGEVRCLSLLGLIGPNISVAQFHKIIYRLLPVSLPFSDSRFAFSTSFPLSPPHGWPGTRFYPVSVNLFRTEICFIYFALLKSVIFIFVSLSHRDVYEKRNEGVCIVCTVLPKTRM